jgi:hypothetical protein
VIPRGRRAAEMVPMRLENLDLIAAVLEHYADPRSWSEDGRRYVIPDRRGEQPARECLDALRAARRVGRW